MNERPENRVVTLASRDPGAPAAELVALETREIAALAEGELLVRNISILVSPATILQIVADPVLMANVRLGGTLRALGVGEVIQSRAPAHRVGELVCGPLGAQEYYRGTANGLETIDAAGLPPRLFLGALGNAGLAAYFGLLHAGRMAAGDVVMITSACGSVGSIAGQLARHHGCTVLGTAGSARKCRDATTRLGFHQCFDYRDGDVAAALQRQQAPRFDLLFDTVGGALLDRLLLHLGMNCRVVLCGATALYDNRSGFSGLVNYPELMARAATMGGFSLYDHRAGFPAARAELRRMIEAGQLVVTEHVETGLDRFAGLLADGMAGRWSGTTVIDL